MSSFVKTCRSSDGTSILYSTFTGGTAIITEDFVGRLKSGSLTQEELRALEEMELFVDSIEAERLDVLNLFDVWNRSRRTLNVIAVMSLACNLRCVYCYEGGRKGPDTHMSEETADNLVRFLSGKLDGNDTIHVDFYGGEPLLGLSRIIDISKRMADIAQKNGVRYDFSLVTNGTLLTPAVLDSLIPLGLKSLKVTIDGPGDIHDVQRPGISGRGSFETIVQNIMGACKRTSVQIGGNFSKRNYARFPELLDYLLGMGLNPRKILAVKFDPISEPEARHKIPSFGGGCRSINEPWLMQASVYLRNEILRRGFFTPRISISPCMVYFDKEYVVNHDGSLYKCPGFLCHDEYCIGHLDRPEIEDSNAYRPDIWKNERCLGCAYLPLCFGGCRYMEFVRSGNIEKVDCRYDYYEATLGTLLAQDIKYGSER